VSVTLVRIILVQVKQVHSMRETSPFDLDRSSSVDRDSSSDRVSILERFRQRIAASDHIKLS